METTGHAVNVEIYSLQFELATPPPQLTFIVVPLDTGSRIARPAERGKSWLDVEAGNVIIVDGKRWVVKNVWPYRTSLCTSDYRAVKSGRAWLEEVSLGKRTGFASNSVPSKPG